jgi:hypothetical protein
MLHFIFSQIFQNNLKDGQLFLPGHPLKFLAINKKVKKGIV